MTMRKRILVFISFVFAICFFSSPVLADVTFPVTPKDLPKTDATFVFTYDTGEVTGLKVVTPDGRTFEGSPVEPGKISIYIGDAPSGEYKITISGDWTTFKIDVVGTAATTTPTTTAATTTVTTSPTTAATTTSATTTAPTTAATSRTSETTTNAIPAEESTTSSSSAPTAAPIKTPIVTETTVASSSGGVAETSSMPTSDHNEEGLPGDIYSGLSQTADIAEEAIVKLPIVNFISGNKSQVDLWEWGVFSGACFLFGAVIGRVISVHLRNKRRAENDLSVEVKYNEKDLF